MNYGVVAEFNPFHNGHKYLVESLKKNESDTVTAVMSESFVQRGECACLSPYERTKTALLNGVDLVLSLPVQYATASAEIFGNAGVTVLASSGVIDCLGFGAETDDANCLEECAHALLKESLKPFLDKRLSEGNSFPKARQLALSDMCESELSSVIETPNNILAVEYIKSILKNDFDLKVYPVKRLGVSHDSQEIIDNVCSASAVRELLKNGGDCNALLPTDTSSVLKENIKNGKAPADFKKLENALIYKLRTLTLQDIKTLPDVSEGLEYRIFEAVKTSVTLDEILEKIKTKRYTHSRLRRILLCALLGIKKDDLLIPVPYIRVLGFNEKGALLLKNMKNKATLPIVTKSSQIENLSEDAKRTFSLECISRDIFSLSLPIPDECGKVMTDKINALYNV